MIVKNDLFDYEDRFIYQDNDFYKFSIDSILLAEFAKVIKKASVVVDLCSGNMAVPLIMSMYHKSKFYGFEIQKSIYDLAVKSVEINNLQDIIHIINDDANNISRYFKPDSIDIITCNPPYFKVSPLSLTNDIKEIKFARHEILITLEDVFKIAHTYLKNGGSLCLVHRVERLDEIIILGEKYNVNVKEIQIISTKNGSLPKILLIKARKNSNHGVKIMPEICIEGLKTYKNMFER